MYPFDRLVPVRLRGAFVDATVEPVEVQVWVRVLGDDRPLWELACAPAGSGGPSRRKDNTMSVYQRTARHDRLGKYQIIRGDDLVVVEQRVRAKQQMWEEMWQRQQASAAKRQAQQEKAFAAAEGRALAEERTREAQNALLDLERLLAHTLGVNDAVDWETLKDRSEFAKAAPGKPAPPTIKPEPQEGDPRYTVTLGTIDKLVKSRKAAKEKEAAEE